MSSTGRRRSYFRIEFVTVSRFGTECANGRIRPGSLGWIAGQPEGIATRQTDLAPGTSSNTKYHWRVKFTITTQQDEDGMYISECPSIPGCLSQGASEAEAVANIEDAIRECLAVRSEQGLPLTIRSREVEVAV